MNMMQASKESTPWATSQTRGRSPAPLVIFSSCKSLWSSIYTWATCLNKHSLLYELFWIWPSDELRWYACWDLYSKQTLRHHYAEILLKLGKNSIFRKFSPYYCSIEWKWICRQLMLGYRSLRKYLLWQGLKCIRISLGLLLQCLIQIMAHYRFILPLIYPQLDRAPWYFLMSISPLALTFYLPDAVFPWQ